MTTVHRAAAELSALVQQRKTCKAFVPGLSLSAEQMQAVLDILRYAPSSINSQAWRFMLASSASGREQVAQGMAGAPFSYNAQKVRDGAVAVVFCTRTDFSDAEMGAMLAQENADGRFASPELMAQRRSACQFFVRQHRQRQTVPSWLERQLYIPLGQLLLAAPMLGLAACPIEGFDSATMDAALGLPQQGLRSVVVVVLGQSSTADWNATLPKSRRPLEQVVQWLD